MIVSKGMLKKVAISLKLSPAMLAEIDQACARQPFRTSRTAFIEEAVAAMLVNEKNWIDAEKRGVVITAGRAKRK